MHMPQRAQLPNCRRVTEREQQTHITRMAHRAEPRQRSITSASPRSRREHHRPNQPDQQRQPHDTAPTPPELTPRQHANRAHVKRSSPKPPHAPQQTPRPTNRRPRRSPHHWTPPPAPSQGRQNPPTPGGASPRTHESTVRRGHVNRRSAPPFGNRIVGRPPIDSYGAAGGRGKDCGSNECGRV